MKRIFKLTNEERENIKEKIKEILKEKEDILFAYIHGSFLLDLPIHDVDLAIFLLNSDSIAEDVIDFEIRLSIELELLIGIPIDIKVINFAPLPFKYNITKGKLLFSKNDQVRYTFIERTWLKFLDFKPHLYKSFNYLFNI